jgi:hypothetical protein
MLLQILEERTRLVYQTLPYFSERGCGLQDGGGGLKIIHCRFKKCFPLPHAQVWERMNITVETSSACAVAAVLSPQFKELAGPDVKRVGVVLCGGNVDLDNLPWINHEH